MHISGAFGLFCFVYSSDHFKERSLHTVVSMGLALVGLIVMSTSTNPALRYGFTHVCLAGAFSAGPLIVTWIAGNTPLTVRHNWLYSWELMLTFVKGISISNHRNQWL